MTNRVKDKSGNGNHAILKIRCRICDKKITWENFMNDIPDSTLGLCFNCYNKHGGGIYLMARKATNKLIKRLRKEREEANDDDS